MSDAAPGAAADLAAPLTPAEQAVAKIAELKGNSDWLKRHLNGSQETRQEMASLHELAYAPAPGSVISGMPTHEAQLADQAEWAANNYDVPPEVIQQIRDRTPISEQEYKQTVARKNALMADPAFRARALAGDAAAQRELFLINVNLSSPIRIGA
jgi:hypothetical protein